MTWRRRLPNTRKKNIQFHECLWDRHEFVVQTSVDVGNASADFLLFLPNFIPSHTSQSQSYKLTQKRELSSHIKPT